jgi:signal recognition particle subunit SRP68
VRETTSPLPEMDITKFVSEFRESAFLLGDYSTYRAQVARRIRIVQKKLGRATPKNAKYAAKAPVTAADVASNIEYAGAWVFTETR